MTAKFSAAIVLFASSALAYPSDADRATVPEWDALAVAWGFDYEMYTATTDDQWILQLFRITGKAGQPTVASDKPPVFIQHGSTMDAASWISYYAADGGLDPMPVQLVAEGYDVWMGNNRGTRYSNKLVGDLYNHGDDPNYTRDYATQNAAKFDYSWFEMGVSDLPAMIDKVVEVTQQPKVTYIGYSQGTSQMFYGLTQKEDTYFADKVAKAIFMAPCIYTTTLGLDSHLAIFPVWRDLGVNVVNDRNWGYDLDEICYEDATTTACQFAKYMSGQPNSVKSLELFDQIAIADRFQVYNPNFSSTNVETELVTPGLDSIDTVPIQMMVANNDSICSATNAIRLHLKIPAVKTYYVVPGDNDHDVFAWNNFPDFMAELVNQIELDPFYVEPEVVPVPAGASFFGMGVATVLAAVVALF